MTRRNADRIYRAERQDWDRNAAFYRDDERSPLMHILARRRDCCYGIKPGEKVLDIGCGTGGTLARLKSAGADVIGVDFSTAMLNVAAERRSLTGRVVCADAAELPFETDSFDVAVADGLLHHLAVQGRLYDALHEIHRVLRPSGRLCCFDRNGTAVSYLLLKTCIGIKSLLRLAKGGGHFPSSATRHEIPFGGRRDLDIIRRCGFRLTHRRDVASLPFFLSVAALNTVQYVFSGRLRRFLERKVAGLPAWIEKHCTWHWLCVEQIAVFERQALPIADKTGARSAENVARTTALVGAIN